MSSGDKGNVPFKYTLAEANKIIQLSQVDRYMRRPATENRAIGTSRISPATAKTASGFTLTAICSRVLARQSGHVQPLLVPARARREVDHRRARRA